MLFQSRRGDDLQRQSVRITIDNHILALDTKQLQRNLEPEIRRLQRRVTTRPAGPSSPTAAPTSGVSGGESTTRGFRLDPTLERNCGAATPSPRPASRAPKRGPSNSDAWKYGGGPTWRSGSYDSELDLVYWGTGTPEPYDPKNREGLDSLYTSSMLAIRPKRPRSPATINSPPRIS